MPDLFFDGATSRGHGVELNFAALLEIREDGATIAAWPYRDVRRADAPLNALRLSCVSAPKLARLEVRDAASRHAIQRLCPALDGPGGTERISAVRIAAWSAAAAAVIAATIWFGIPALADGLAEVIPFAWERPLGQAVDNQVRALIADKTCAAPEGEAALTKLVGRLQEAARLPLPPEPVVLQSAVPNAFAVPGGRVYVLSGLLDKARSADELAGVLGHEFGHIAHRDGLRRLIRDGGTGFLAGLLFGDVSGAGAALYAAKSLLSAAYSRDLEANADAFAITVMHRLGRPAAPLGALLLRITGPQTESLSILSDHPLTPERARMLEADDQPATGPALLSAPEWAALKAICR